MTLLPSEARVCADLVQAVGVPGAVQLLRPEAMAAAVAVLGYELGRLQAYAAGEMDRAASAALPPDGPALCEQTVPADKPAGNVAEPVAEEVDAQATMFHRARRRTGVVVHLCRDGENASICGVHFKPGEMLCLSDDDEVTCGFCARFWDRKVMP